MIWIPNQLIGAAIGKDVTLECITEAMPKAISYWVYNGTMVIMTSSTSTFFLCNFTKFFGLEGNNNNFYL